MNDMSVETETQAKVYRTYTQAELDAQYDQSSLVGDNAEYKKFKRSESERVRRELKARLDVAYGPSPAERLDIFEAEVSGAPTILFFHGGAWKGGHKDDVSYLAEGFVKAGANCVVVNFGLVPEVRLAEQVRQSAAAVAWVYRQARDFGGDPERVFVTGHSSGGHLTGMMIVTDWVRLHGLPANVVKGAAPFSGMYDLEPVQLSWRNDYLRLNVEEARTLSPIRHIPAQAMPLVIGYGSGELDEFKRQSRDFAAAWRERGYPCTEIELPGLNHFDVQRELGNAKGSVFPALLNMMGLR
jgi:arylformamidase